MIRIIPIASGSTGNALYLQIDDHKLLIDAGVSCKKIRSALNNNGIELSDIDALFITHSHYDHISGLKVTSKNLGCNAFASKRTIDDVFSLCTLRKIKMEYDEKTEVLPGLFVTLFETSHDCAGSGGFVFETENEKVAYATDLGYVSDKIKEYLKGSRVVILESNHDVEMLKNGPYPADLKKRIFSKHGHLSNAECAEEIIDLYDSGTRHFLLAHLSQENNTPEKALQETLNALNGKQADIYVCPVYTTEIKEY